MEGSTAIKTGLGTNVQVAVRCRPLNSEERKSSQPTVISCNSENKLINVSYGPAGKKTTKAFTFDKVFGMYSTQEEVFEGMVRPIIDESLAGFNCTIFAYGQTGTGKTHTMEGDIHSADGAGIVPRSVKNILEQLEASGAEFTIRVSFLELYNEEIQDLLNTSGEKKIKLCEDVKKGVVCQNLEEITVLNAADILDILERGIQQRQTAATLCNKNSSRSHSIFTMKIMIKESSVDGEEVVRHGQLNLVDLAGSECVGRSGAKNERLTEAGNINKSLLTLGRVITALVDHHSHIPYRDSKLTRLLQESLGGKAKTCIIATLSPSQGAVEESMSTLDYAHRAKNIKNQPTVNQKLTKKVILKEYCAEIEQLRSQLQLTREKNGIYMDPEQFYAMESKISTQESLLLECEAALKVRETENKALKSERAEIESRLEEKQAKVDEITEELTDVKSLLSETTSVLDETKHELINTKDNLCHTQASLKMTALELKATEQVVCEQVETEESLQIQGNNLKDEVSSRRDDVDKLLRKVDRLSEKELIRISETAALVSAVVKDKEILLQGINDILLLNKSDSSTLCEGVTEMLSKGRLTCVTLTESIEEALSTLINDAQEAKITMVDSCDGLKSHFNTTNKHLESTLSDMQLKLSSWLGEVDGIAQQMQNLLAHQQSKLRSHSQDIANRCASLEAMHKTFADSIAKQIEATKCQTEELKKELSEQLVEYQNEINVAAQQAKSLVVEKAEMMEKVLRDELDSRLQLYERYRLSVEQETEKQRRLEQEEAEAISKRKTQAQLQRERLKARMAEEREKQDMELKNIFLEQSRREEEEARAAADRKNQIELQRQELEAKMKALFERQDREHQEIIKEQTRREEEEAALIAQRKKQIDDQRRALEERIKEERERQEKELQEIMNVQIRKEEEEAQAVAQRKLQIEQQRQALALRIKMEREEQDSERQRILLEQIAKEEEEAARVAERKRQIEQQRCKFEERVRAEREKQQKEQEEFLNEQIRKEEEEASSSFERKQQAILQQKSLVASLDSEREVQETRQLEVARSLLEDIVQSTSSSIEVNVSVTSQLCATLENLAITRSSQLDKTLTDTADINSSFSTSFINSITESSTAHLHNVSEIQFTNDEVNTHLSGITRDVITRKDNLDQTVSILLQNVNEAIVKGCQVVDDTAQTASTLLKDVTVATDRMNSTASQAMKDFTIFLDGKGEDISTTLGAHFSEVESKLSSQCNGLNTLEEAVSNYGSVVVESVTVPTGSTPKKTIFAELPVLKSTRDHSIIKNEVKTSAVENSSTDSTEEIIPIDAENVSPEDANEDIASVIADKPQQVFEKELLMAETIETDSFLRQSEFDDSSIPSGENANPNEVTEDKQEDSEATIVGHHATISKIPCVGKRGVAKKSAVTGISKPKLTNRSQQSVDVTPDI